jgi:hypothetical protein
MRFVYFGDSWTYGHGLADCLNSSPDTVPRQASRLGWTHRLAEMFGVEYVNCAWPGESNLRMLWKIRQMPFSPDDFVIIQWSFQDRDTILDGTQEIIGPWSDTRRAKHYFLAHPEQDMENRNLLTIEHAALWLERRGLKWMFFSNILLRGEGSETVQRLIVDQMGDYSIKGDLASDGIHYGPQTNEVWAKRVYDCVRNYQTNPSIQPRP